MSRLPSALAALAAGFGLFALLTALTTVLTRWLLPAWSAMPPPRGVRLFNLAATCLFGAAGGRATACAALRRVPPADALWLGLVLALLVLVLTAAAAFQFRGHRLGWYPLALAVLPPAATLGAAILEVLSGAGCGLPAR